MSIETSATIRMRLPAAIQQSLTNDASTPLQHWLNANSHDSVALMRFASTFSPDVGFSIVLAAATACLLDAAAEHRPVKVAYVVPLFRSITEGQVSVQYLDDTSTGIFDDDAPSPLKTIPLFDEYIAIGLARTQALDGRARKHLLKQSLASGDLIHTALGWFAFDLETADRRDKDELSQRFPSHWADAYPDDPDAPIARLRAYLQAARKVGVVGALTPLEQETRPELSVAEAAWAVAWDEAARANAHSICADLALRRANQLEPQSPHQHRWLLIYGFHEEHKPERRTDSSPVSRHLLDMIYHVERPFVPASLCVSIAARTDWLEPVLRETLPYLQGPTVPLLQAAFGVGQTLVSLAPLADINPAGALLALRMQRRNERERAAGIEPATDRKTPPPEAILDNFENNEDFLNGHFDFEEEATLPRAKSEPDPADNLDPDAMTLSDDRSELEAAHPDRGAEFIRWSEEWEDDLKTEQISPDSAPQPIRATQSPHTPTSLSAHVDDEDGDKNDDAQDGPTAAPTELDIFLAVSLPDDLRERADVLLARRLSSSSGYSAELLNALDAHVALLPESAWLVAQALRQQGQHASAAGWMETVARATTDRPMRAARYKALGRCWVDNGNDPAQALEYLVVSFTCAPTDGETLELLDRCYTALRRQGDLQVAYRSALQAATIHPVPDTLRRQWERRLQQLQKDQDRV